MTQSELTNTWNYFLSLENDIAATSRYIEPNGQENVFSFEFSKLLMLSCTEVESVLKTICSIVEGRECGNIGEYKEIILKHYSKIVLAEVFIPRWGKTIRPFDGWDSGILDWWDAYVAIKHNRESSFESATYKNAVYALSALYVLILYLAKICGLRIDSEKSTYIISAYAFRLLACEPGKELPDYDTEIEPLSSGTIQGTARIYYKQTEPPESNEGDIWFRKIDRGDTP